MSKPVQEHEHSDHFAYGGPTVGGPAAPCLCDEMAQRPMIYLITDIFTRTVVGIWVRRFPDICGPLLAVGRNHSATDSDLSSQRGESLESSTTRYEIDSSVLGFFVRPE